MQDLIDQNHMDHPTLVFRLNYKKDKDNWHGETDPIPIHIKYLDKILEKDEIKDLMFTRGVLSRNNNPRLVFGVRSRNGVVKIDPLYLVDSVLMYLIFDDEDVFHPTEKRRNVTRTFIDYDYRYVGNLSDAFDYFSDKGFLLHIRSMGYDLSDIEELIRYV